MAKKDTLFTVVGITTHSGQDENGVTSTRTKVRYGTDMVRLIKMLTNPKKIEDKTLNICLAPVRVDFVDLPNAMLKDEALKHMLTMEQFSSAEDQQLIKDTIVHREPKPKHERKKSEAKIKTTKKGLSLDSIRQRKKNVSVEEVLAAVKETE
jgi:hypothetical protein